MNKRVIKFAVIPALNIILSDKKTAIIYPETDCVFDYPIQISKNISIAACVRSGTANPNKTLLKVLFNFKYMRYKLLIFSLR